MCYALGSDDAGKQIRLCLADTRSNYERETSSGDDESSLSELEAADDTEDSDSLNLGNIKQPASNEDEGDRYTICAIARKLRYSPNSKAEFIEILSIIRCKDAMYYLEQSDINLAQTWPPYLTYSMR
ncbi:hypothetical protein H4Q26_006724 [Puccinia striiformis f. sp. tritici PST-130]|nr:hypothetical protein H4Q26_006724 [Puccinia striiformis f. sp. tritici PST-130]